MEYFEYGEKEISHLKSRDARLGRVIDRVGFIKREVNPDLFAALVCSIIEQQISRKTALTIAGRLTTLLQQITPQSVAAADLDSIRGCGIPDRKAGYIKMAADLVLSGGLDLEGLCRLSDEEVVKTLTALPGIGRWTAEMLLIFSMRRPDVVSYSDLGIRRGMKRVYGLKELTRKQFMHYRNRYSPHGTVASFYLWAASRD